MTGHPATKQAAESRPAGGCAALVRLRIGRLADFRDAIPGTLRGGEAVSAE
jgi:hypothetical protein